MSVVLHLGSVSMGAAGLAWTQTQDNYVFAVDNTSLNLLSFDLTNPLFPIAASSYNKPSSYLTFPFVFRQINNDGSITRFLKACDGNNLQINTVDLSNPYNPVAHGLPIAMAWQFTNALGAYDSGTLATSIYYATLNNGNGQPMMVSPIAASQTGGVAQGKLFWHGDYLAINKDNILADAACIYDVSQPASPVLLASPNGPITGGTQLQFANGYAFTTDGGSLYALNLNAAPALAKWNVVSPAGMPAMQRFIVCGNYIVLLLSGSPVSGVIDITNPAAPVMLQNLVSPAMAGNMYRYNYVAINQYIFYLIIDAVLHTFFLWPHDTPFNYPVTSLQRENGPVPLTRLRNLSKVYPFFGRK